MAIQLNLFNFLDRIDHSWLEVLSKANSVTFDPINGPVWSVDVTKQGMTLSLFHYDSAWTKLKGSVIFMQNLTVNFSGFLLLGICMKGASFPNTVLSGRMTTTCCIQNAFSHWDIFVSIFNKTSQNKILGKRVGGSQLLQNLACILAAKLPCHLTSLTHCGRDKMADIFKCIFLNENCCILIKISLKYVLKGSIDNNPALVQIMAWCRIGNKPLFEPMMVSLLTHICISRPQWVKK